MLNKMCGRIIIQSGFNSPPHHLGHQFPLPLNVLRHRSEFTYRCAHWASFTNMCIEMFLLCAQNKCACKITVRFMKHATSQFCSYHRVYASESESL